jgi:hypothetical protein
MEWDQTLAIDQPFSRQSMGMADQDRDGVYRRSSATFALNAALCFLRVRFMSCPRAIRAF